MAQMVEVRAIVRLEMLDRVVHCLKDSGVPRLTATQVHAIGAGADPATRKLSLEEGSAIPTGRWCSSSAPATGVTCTVSSSLAVRLPVGAATASYRYTPCRA